MDSAACHLLLCTRQFELYHEAAALAFEWTATLIAIYTSAPELRGTMAAPEPIASCGHFYEDAELVQLARQAGLVEAHVANDGGGQLLTAGA